MAAVAGARIAAMMAAMPLVVAGRTGGGVDRIVAMMPISDEDHDEQRCAMPTMMPLTTQAAVGGGRADGAVGGNRDTGGGDGNDVMAMMPAMTMTTMMTIMAIMPP